MTTIDANKAFRNLKLKGFVGSKRKYSDYKYFEFYHNDQLVLHTKITRGEESTLGSAVIRQMAYQCHLTEEELVALTVGEMTQEDYVAILKEKGVI